jgi:hypothetical protein
VQRLRFLVRLHPLQMAVVGVSVGGEGSLLRRVEMPGAGVNGNVCH